MSPLLLFLILLLAGLFIVFLGRRVRGPLKYLAFLGGAAAALIGFYGVLTYFL